MCNKDVFPSTYDKLSKKTLFYNIKECLDLDYRLKFLENQLSSLNSFLIFLLSFFFSSDTSSIYDTLSAISLFSMLFLIKLNNRFLLKLDSFFVPKLSLPLCKNINKLVLIIKNLFKTIKFNLLNFYFKKIFLYLI